MGSLDIPPFMREQMKKKIQQPKVEEPVVPPFMQQQEPIKKKETLPGGLVSGLEAGVSESTEKRIKEGELKGVGYSEATPEAEKLVLLGKQAVDFDEDDPIKSIATPIRSRLDDIRKQRMGIESVGQDKKAKEIISSEITDLLNKKREIETAKFGNAKEAEFFLKNKIDLSRLIPEKPLDITKQPTLDDFSELSIIGNTPQDNETAKVALQQYLDNRRVREALATSATLEEAALKSAQQRGGLTGKQIRELDGNVPQAMKGNIMLNFLQSDELQELAKANPEINNQLLLEYEKFPSRYPTAAIRILAEKVSEIREQQGENNAILNLPSQRKTDQIVNDLIAKGELPQNWKEFYDNKSIRFLVNANLRTPGIIENFAQSTGEAVEGIGKSVAELSGVRNLYKDTDDKLYDELTRQYQSVGFKPKGLLHEISTSGGIVTGQVLPMALGGNLLRATKFVQGDKAANAIMAGFQTFGYNRDRAIAELPGASTSTQLGYATINTGIEMALANMLNDTKLARTLMGKAGDDVKNIITKFTQKEISAAAAKAEINNLFKTIIEKGPKFAKGASRTSVTEANEEAATEILQTANNQVFGGEPIKFSQAANEAFEVWRTTLLGSLFLGLAGGKAELMKNSDTGRLVLEMASNPEKYREIIQGQAAIDDDYAKDVNKKIENLDYISQVKAELDSKPELSQSQKERYLIQSLNQKMLQEKSDAIPDKTLKKSTDELIKESEEAKEKILSEKPKPEEEIKGHMKFGEETRRADLIQDAKSLSEDLDEVNRNAFNADPEQFLKEAAEQLNASPSESAQARRTYGDPLSDIALELFPDAKVETSPEMQALLAQEKDTPSGIETTQTEEIIPEQVQETTTEEGVGGRGDVEGSEVVGKGDEKSEADKSYEEGLDKEQKGEKKFQDDKGKTWTVGNTDLKGGGRELWEMVYEEEPPNVKTGTEMGVGDRGELGTIFNMGGVQKAMIEDALKEGLYEKAIKSGKMSAGYAKRVIESAGLEVPQDILIDAGVEKSNFQKNKANETATIQEEVKEGFTEGEDLNKIYAGLKSKYGDKKGAMLYEVANRLVNPNKNTIIEIRGNGVVVKEGGKYILKPFGNTDANSKKWTLYKGMDVTNQFVKEQPNETTQEATQSPQSKSPIQEGQATEGITEPPLPPTEAVFSERPPTQLSFRGLQNIANEFGLDDVKSRERKSDVQLYQDARSTAEDWAKKGTYYSNIEKLLRGIESREFIPTDKHKIILQQYLANESQKLRNIQDKNSEEYDAQFKKIKRIKDIAEIARQESGATLRVDIGGGSHPITDYADAAVAMAEAASVDVLTEAQKAEVEKLVVNYEEKARIAEQKLADVEAKFAELQAEKEITNLKKKSKKTNKDYSEERKQIINDIRDKLKKARQETTATVIPYAKELIAIAPDVAKLVKNLVEQGVSNLADIVTEVYGVLKDDIPDIQEKDVLDIIAGEYSKKRPTKTDLQKQLEEIRIEASLYNRLENLLKGEVPKSEKAKIERNRKIKELRDQIKDIELFDKEVEKIKNLQIEERAEKYKTTQQELSKAEKEIEDLEERDRKVKQREAELESKRLQKEFEKEKKSEEKAKIKAKLDAAKELEKQLSYRTPEEKTLASLKSRYEKRAKEIREKISKGDFEKIEKPISWVNDTELKRKYPDLYNQALDAVAAKEQAQLDFDIALYKAERAKMGKVKKGIDLARSLIATSKAIKSGIDDSAIMIQNAVAMIAHPRSAAKALKEHALDAISEKRFRRYLTELHQSPIWDLMVKSGLDITDPKSLQEQNKEEIFDKNLLNKDIKIRGKKYNLGKYITRPFERAFTSLGNAMRVNMFTRIAERMMQEGKTFETHPQEFKDLATVLNTETGRGRLHTQIQRASQLVTAGIWSPRLMSSRINMIGLSDIGAPLYGGKGYYSGLTKEARNLALYDMAKFIGAGVAFMALSGALGAEVDDDPESPTFGTVQYGNKKYNTWGGFTPYIKTVVSGITGKRRIKGERVPVTRSKILGSFFRSRLTPAAGVTTNLLTGKDFSGRPITPQGELANLIAPISITSMAEAMSKDGAIGLLTHGLPSFVGVGVSDERDFPEVPKNTFEIKYETTEGKFAKRQPTEEEYKQFKELSKTKYDELIQEIKTTEVYIDRYGDVVLEEDDEGVSKPYEKLNKDELKQLEQKIKNKASREAKKELFGDLNQE